MTFSQRMDEQLIGALKLAQASQSAVVIRRWESRPFPSTFDTLTTPWVYYREPSQFEVFGFGSAWGRSGPHLRALASDVDAIRQQVVNMGDPPMGKEEAPLFFGGSAFSPRSAPLAPPWDACPSAYLFIPATLHFTTFSEGWRIRTTVAYPDSSIDALRHDLLDAPPERRAKLSDGLASLGHLETEQQWTQRVQAVIEHVQQAALTKIVLARGACETVPDKFQLHALCHHLATAHSQCGIFALQLADDAFFVGASPEILVEQNRHTVRAHAVAGTLPRGSSAAEDQELTHQLMHDSKLRDEQAIVTDDIVDILTPLVDELECGNPAPLKLNHVQHVHTVIKGRAHLGESVLTFVDALHPTPALGGFPRPAADAYLAEHETLERGWYGGPIGWLDANGSGIFRVAIRSALVKGRNAIVYAGAGIIEGSNPDAEWTETEFKMKAMRHALNSLGETID